jgi:hypothetical protein
MNATTPEHPPSQARPGDTWKAGAGQRTTHAHTIPNRPIARNQPRDGTTSLIHGFRLSGLARNFGDVFELWSGGQCGVGVVVSGDALE